MTEYTARVTREGALWVIDVGGVGVTQSPSLAKVEPMARALVVDLLEVSPESVELEVTIDLPRDVEARLSRVRSTAAKAAELTSKAAQEQRDVVEDLAVNKQLSGSDIAKILKITPARVSQLRGGERRGTRRATAG